MKLENGGTVAEYQYDGLNRRTVKTANSVTRHYYHSDQWQVLEERTGSNTSADRQYVWGERYVDDLVLRDHDSTRLYALNDALFNVVALTDNTGSVKERFAYQPYGESQQLNPDFSSYSGTDYEWEYRFTGRELDLESMLQINRNRYLHQQLGRWLTRDPIGYDGSDWSLYEYVESRPVDGSDPNGLLTREECRQACQSLNWPDRRYECYDNCDKRFPPSPPSTGLVEPLPVLPLPGVGTGTGTGAAEGAAEAAGSLVCKCIKIAGPIGIVLGSPSECGRGSEWHVDPPWVGGKEEYDCDLIGTGGHDMREVARCSYNCVGPNGKTKKYEYEMPWPRGTPNPCPKNPKYWL